MTDQDLWAIVAWYGDGLDDVEVIGPFAKELCAKNWITAHEVTEPYVIVKISDPQMSSLFWKQATDVAKWATEAMDKKKE